jgi:hypothetical protein|tara:strand:+ start:85 stop:255 length:171 start_codon:yes stop_codon:yes gene_type:complete
MIYKDLKVTLFSELCKHYESNNKDFYNILDDIVEILEKKQINSLLENLKNKRGLKK